MLNIRATHASAGSCTLPVEVLMFHISTYASEARFSPTVVHCLQLRPRNMHATAKLRNSACDDSTKPTVPNSSPGNQRAHVRVCSTMFNTGSCSAWLETEAQQSMRQSGSRTVPVALLLNPPCRIAKQVTTKRKFESAVLCSISEQPM